MIFLDDECKKQFLTLLNNFMLSYEDAERRVSELQTIANNASFEAGIMQSRMNEALRERDETKAELKSLDNAYCKLKVDFHRLENTISNNKDCELVPNFIYEGVKTENEKLKDELQCKQGDVARLLLERDRAVMIAEKVTDALKMLAEKLKLIPQTETSN